METEEINHGWKLYSAAVEIQLDTQRHCRENRHKVLRQDGSPIPCVCGQQVVVTDFPEKGSRLTVEELGVMLVKAETTTNE